MLAIMFYDCPEIRLFILGIKDMYKVLSVVNYALRFFGCVLTDAVIYSSRLLNEGEGNLMKNLKSSILDL